MGLLTAGILGGIAGGAQKVVEVSDDQRKSLAEKLKMEALEAMQGRQAATEHGYRMEEQGVDIKARADLSASEQGAVDKRLDTEIAANKDITSMKIKADKELADKEASLKERMLSQDIKQTEIGTIKNQIAAYGEARKTIENGGTIEDANMILEAAGLPGMEEYVIDPGSEGGWFGWGKREPVTGKRMKGSGLINSEITTGETDLSGEGNNLKSDLDRLIAEGKKKTPASSERAQFPDEEKSEQYDITQKVKTKDMITEAEIMSAMRLYNVDRETAIEMIKEQKGIKSTVGKAVKSGIIKGASAVSKGAEKGIDFLNRSNSTPAF